MKLMGICRTRVAYYAQVLLVGSVALLAAAELNQATEERMHVAILTLRNAEGVSLGDAEIITDRLRAELFNTGKVIIMEREQMQEVLKEQGFQQSGACSDEACMVQVGKLLGVRQLVTGSIGRLGTLFLINIRVVDVQTGQVIRVVSRDLAGMESVVSQLGEMSQEIVGMPKLPTGRMQPRALEPIARGEKPKDEVVISLQPAQTEITKNPSEPLKVKDSMSRVTQKPDLNKNRLGIRLGMNACIGETWFTVDTDSGKIAKNDVVDTVRSYPQLSANVTIVAPAGPLVSFEIGGAYTKWKQEMSYRDSVQLLHALTLQRSMWSISAGLALVFWAYPVKINIAPLVGFNLMTFSMKSHTEAGTADSTLMKNSGVGAFSFGGRAGVEYLLNEYVGLNVDFLYRKLVFTYKQDRKNITQTLPSMGIGAGINFYF